MTSLYAAGSEPPLSYNIRVEFELESYGKTRADMITRWIEFWCQENCSGSWRVEEYAKFVDVSFNEISDIVLFKLSPEYALS